MNEKLNKAVDNFLFPKLNRKFAVRLIVVVLFCFLFFKFVCKPVWLNGGSMEPNYHTGTLNFCWTPTYWFRQPRSSSYTKPQILQIYLIVFPAFHRFIQADISPRAVIF